MEPTKDHQEAWFAVYRLLKEHSRGFSYGGTGGLDCALTEIRRLQALDKPTAISTDVGCVEAWNEIWSQIVDYNPAAFKLGISAKDCALQELRRLQDNEAVMMDVPTC